jgi:hypothetical protein
LEERYGTHAGFVAAVKAAADNAACKGYLLAKGPAKDGSMPKCTFAADGFPDDWATLVNQAIDSNVCNQPTDGGKWNPAAPRGGRHKKGRLRPPLFTAEIPNFGRHSA